MALPAIKTLQACGSYAKTVEPFLPALYGLPRAFADTIATSVTDKSVQPLLQLYLDTNPLVSGFAASLVLGAVFFVVSEINDNYSQVDRSWSVLPVLYVSHFYVWARLHGLSTDRLDLVMVAVFDMGSGYKVGSEDYRWAVVKRTLPAFLFHLLNLTFISFIQSILLYLLAVPVYTLLLSNRIESSNVGDVLFLFGHLDLVAIEYFADGQQWAYQEAKRSYRETTKVPTGFTQAALDRGFVAEGLWAYSRHPNFAAEQAFWVLLYRWSCYATDSLFTWAGVGAVFLLLLFQGSTWLTELITAGKYPQYKLYQRKVGMFVPTSIWPYRTPPPKVLRTSELAKRQGKTVKASGVQTQTLPPGTNVQKR